MPFAGVNLRVSNQQTHFQRCDIVLYSNHHTWYKTWISLFGKSRSCPRTTTHTTLQYVRPCVCTDLAALHASEGDMIAGTVFWQKTLSLGPGKSPNCGDSLLIPLPWSWNTTVWAGKREGFTVGSKPSCTLKTRWYSGVHFLCFFTFLHFHGPFYAGRINRLCAIILRRCRGRLANSKPYQRLPNSHQNDMCATSIPKLYNDLHRPSFLKY